MKGKRKMRFYHQRIILLLSILMVIPLSNLKALGYPVAFTDDLGSEVIIKEKPSSVVSLVPSVTEIIYRLGAGDVLKAITYFSTYPPETAEKEIVGGFFSPSLDRIEMIQPDVIFCSDLHKKVMERFRNGKCQLITINLNSISDSYESIVLLGRIFNRQEEADAIVNDIKEQLRTIALKTGRIPSSERKRVIRLMGRDQVMTPGDDSFQNELIRLAGGIPPALNKKGNIVPVTEAEWIKFNPQVIYGCGGDSKTAEAFFSRPGWKDVDAVRQGNIFYFPCDLTCRASTRTGHFVSWLAARIYGDEFSKEENLVFEERVLKTERMDIALDYVSDIRLVYSYVYDFVNKTLMINFKEPLSVVSTLEGQRHGIRTVGNHYSPPACWTVGHKHGLKGQREHVCKVIGCSEKDSSLLFTGADMDHLAIRHQRFKDMAVYALVTAGVNRNAVRTSADEGNFYEPGTINIILLPNMKLTPRAMTRAVISATEAKTAAIQDLDIRSAYTPLIHQATGTGTDNIIVVEGQGKILDNAGGHSKLGELIAKAVYEGVREAVYKQNGLTEKRNVFRRLQDREMSVFDLLSAYECECNADRFNMVGAIEALLLQPRYAAFIESSFALSDGYERGLISDLSSYGLWCTAVAEEIAGRKIEEMRDLIEIEDIPVVLKMAFNAILNGVQLQMK